MSKPDPHSIYSKFKFGRRSKKHQDKDVLKEIDTREKRKKIFRFTRDEIMEKTGGKCWLCEIEIKREDYSRDHIRPREKGGKDKLNNLMPAHKECNVIKASYTIRCSKDFFGLCEKLNTYPSHLKK